MKILITGATGFIGQHLTKALIKSGHWVTVFCRSPQKALVLKKFGARLSMGNIKDYQNIKNAVKDNQVIFHLAATLAAHKAQEKKYFQVNVLGTKNILEASKNVKLFVHTSSVGIYGPTSLKGKTENSSRHPTDIYSKTKLEGENLVWQKIKKGFPAIIIRPTLVYGPGDRTSGMANLISAIGKRRFIIPGSGQNFFHTLYIDNLIQAYLLCLDKKKAIGKDFNIGDQEASPLKELVYEIAKAQDVPPPPLVPKALLIPPTLIFDILEKIGLPAPLTSYQLNFLTQNRTFPIKKAQKVLGYRPKVALSQGIEKTVKWLKEK